MQGVTIELGRQAFVAAAISAVFAAAVVGGGRQSRHASAANVEVTRPIAAKSIVLVAAPALLATKAALQYSAKAQPPFPPAFPACVALAPPRRAGPILGPVRPALIASKAGAWPTLTADLFAPDGRLRNQIANLISRP
ncbi:MAG: hypothetical protein ABSE69_04495 [Roseiarcus sp.]|jgi:hypothetical protein